MTDEAFLKGLVLVLIPIVCGVIFQAGRLSQRVDTHERELRSVAKAVRDGFDELSRLIRGEAK